jgi:hypothetical protein
MKLLDSLGLVDDQFTLQDGMLVYMWSRMTTVDEVRDFAKYESLLFIDFLEALGHIADMKVLPLVSDLQEAEMNILDWQIAKKTGAAPHPSDAV